MMGTICNSGLLIRMIMISDPEVFYQDDADVGTDEFYYNSAPDAVQNGYDGDTMVQNKPFYFYVQHSIRLKVVTWGQSDGNINKTKQVIRKNTEPLIMMYGKGANTHTLGWIPDGGVEGLDITFFGIRPSYTLTGRVLTFDVDQCPACCTIIYNFEAQQYKYTPPVTDLVDQDDQYPVALRFALETTDG